MPREQVMCAAVSCGSAADDVGLVGASLKWCRSLISGARRFCSKPQAASCYVIHGAFAFVDSNHGTPALCWQHGETIDDRSLPGGPGDYSQVLPHCCAFGAVLVRCALLRQAIGMDARDLVQYQYSQVGMSGLLEIR